MSSRTTYALGAVALVVIAVIVVFVVRSGSNDELTVQDENYGAAHNSEVEALLDSDGAIVLGKISAPKTIDVFEDPMCPSCGVLEHYYGQQISKQLDEGKLAVRYRFVNFLDPKSGTKDYSTRAIGAMECVADAGDGPVFSKFHMALFTSKQPSEGDGSLSNDELAAIAKDSGAPDEVQQCIAKGERVDSARNHAQASMTALKDAVGQAQTPTVLDGGKNVDVQNQDWVTQLAG
ncbi:DsbA family protein [Nocardia vermiculata]|uniref:Thioredoxin domain-containing protein n=1 Tax=Nocardia vermiculata TaxID=257274 RepID=A0A846XXL6_9NOCA|nr:thioredoxin domain-containing protein [Nocardia vermiculata]NKY51916.1 thioredoxin domain-containing protein [Nocardia vermiculata]